MRRMDFISSSVRSSFGLTIVGTIATVVSALSGPAAPIVIPIVASVVIASWVYDVYEQTYVPLPILHRENNDKFLLSRPVLQRFMKYIIDLTLVLQTLYLISENQELSRRAIKLAVKSYHSSPMSGEVHNRIQEYDRQLTLWQRADRDSFGQFVELLQSYNISAGEVSDLRANLPAMDLWSDEPWDTAVEKS
jgi:hypothetical protein